MNPIKKMIERRAARAVERKRYMQLLDRGFQISRVFAAHRYCDLSCAFNDERRAELWTEHSSIVTELNRIGYPR